MKEVWELGLGLQEQSPGISRGPGAVRPLAPTGLSTAGGISAARWLCLPASWHPGHSACRGLGRMLKPSLLWQLCPWALRSLGFMGWNHSRAPSPVLRPLSPPSAQNALGVMDGIVKFQPSPPPEGGLLTTVFSTPSPFVIEDINLFLHPVRSMLSRSQPSPDEVCVCRPLITPIPFGALPDAGTARRTCRRLPTVSSLSIHSPTKQGQVLKE